MKILNSNQIAELAILRKKSIKLTEEDFKSNLCEKITSELSETLNQVENGIGLSAPQIAYNFRIFIISKKIFLGLKRKDLIFINPKIIKKSEDKQIISEEGCLSIPNTYGSVLRYQKIKVEFQNLKGQKVNMLLSNLLAFIFQHELDHLNGILFTDKINFNLHSK